MAFLERLPSGSWRAGYRDAQGTRHSRTFTARRDAVEWAAEQERDVRRGRHYAPRSGRVTVAEYAQVWWAARVCEDTTRATDRGRMDRHVLPRWGGAGLESISPTAVQGWVRQLVQGGLSPATARSCHQLLASVLESARRDGLVPDNPARGVRLPTVPPGREVYLTREQVEAVTARMDPDHAAVVLTLVWTGMRWGEVAGLHVTRVDLLRRRIDVVETLTEVGGTRAVKPYPKGKRRRTVPVPHVLVDVLAAYLARNPRARTDLLFAGLSRHTWARAHLRPAMVEAGVPLVRVHDLRHTYASWLVQDGVSLVEVARLLGHQSVNTTARYSHLVPDAYDGVLSVLDRARVGHTWDNRSDNLA